MLKLLKYKNTYPLFSIFLALLLPSKTSPHPTFCSLGLAIQRGILISIVFLVMIVAMICRATIDLRQDKGQMSADLHGNLWNSTSLYTTESVKTS